MRARLTRERPPRTGFQRKPPDCVTDDGLGSHAVVCTVTPNSQSPGLTTFWPGGEGLARTRRREQAASAAVHVEAGYLRAVTVQRVALCTVGLALTVCPPGWADRRRQVSKAGAVCLCLGGGCGRRSEECCAGSLGCVGVSGCHTHATQYAHWHPLGACRRSDSVPVRR